MSTLFSFALAVILVIAGLGDVFSYGGYHTIKIVVVGAALWNAMRSYSVGRRGWMIASLGVGVLFAPWLESPLESSDWQVADLLAAGIFALVELILVPHAWPMLRIFVRFIVRLGAVVAVLAVYYAIAKQFVLAVEKDEVRAGLILLFTVPIFIVLVQDGWGRLVRFLLRAAYISPRAASE